MKKLLFFTFLLSTLFALTVEASDSNYSSKIAVDVTASDSSTARQIAMNEANRRALTSVIRRLSTTEAVSKVESLTDAEILNFIQETSVVSEKTSPVRYMATLNVTINENLLKAYMREQGIPFGNVSSVNVIVIPVLKDHSGRNVLWEDNDWRKSWETKRHKKGLITFNSIYPTASNYSTIDADRALNLNGQALQEVSHNTGSDNIYIAYAFFKNNNLNITISSYRSGLIETIQIEQTESDITAFTAAVEAVEAAINSHLKPQLIAETSQKSEINVLYEHGGLANWLNIERTLNQIDGIDNINVIAMNNDKVQFKIVYSGSQNALFNKLNNKSITLNENSGLYLLTYQKPY